FEPSDSFYDSLGKLDDPDTEEGRSEITRIFTHLGVPDVPVRFMDGLLHPGEFRYSMVKSLDMSIVPQMIAVSGKYRTIEDTRRRGMAIGAILSHEIAHYCLLKKNILRDFSPDNEELTDLGIIVLGLGKLYFNGRELIVGDKREQLGYLSIEGMVYTFLEYQRGSGISSDALYENIAPEARSRILECQGRIIREMDEYARRERLDRCEAEREALRADVLALRSCHDRACSDLRSVTGSLSVAKKDQEIINRTLAFWEINNEDNQVMGEFVGALFSAVYDADLDHIGKVLHTLNLDLIQIAGVIVPKTTVEKDLLKERQKIQELNVALALQNDQIALLSRKISSVQSAQERCFSGIATVRKELNETCILVYTCRETMKMISSYHRFLGENPAVWHRYGSDRDLAAKITELLGSGEPEAALSKAKKLAEQMDGLLSSRREEYPEMLRRFPGIGDLARAARSRRDEVAETSRTLLGLLASQKAITGEYLEGARLLDIRLQGIRAAFREDQEAMADFKPRQDLIYRNYRTLRCSPEDEQVFMEIMKAIPAGGPDAETIHSMHILEGVGTAAQCDAERVRLLSESEKIIPMETYWKDFGQREEDLDLLHARICRWKETQQKYIDEIEAMQKRSSFLSLKGMGKRIRDSVEGCRTLWGRGKG
ncbi:MAG: hypothetical protein LUQ67_04260, partial [Methanomicrobiales archaeon]|nr:hypothetical protein [Methanomicrobiales archaeon]